MFKKLIVSTICITTLTGCATFKTLDADLPLNQRTFVYSGTRLDWSAITENKPALSKMRVEPPRFPLVDLPFSFALDTLFFPLAVVAVAFN